MTTKNISAFGIYPDQETVNGATINLLAAGFRNTDVSVLYPENLGSKDFGHEKHTKAPEGALAGGGSGAVVGTAIGWLFGAGFVAVPGMEALSAAGPMMAMLSGCGVGTMIGGLSGALVGSGIPEYEAKRYEGRVRKGGILLSVHCDNDSWAKTAKAVLKQTGAMDISTAGEAKADFAQSTKPVPRSKAGHLQEQ